MHIIVIALQAIMCEKLFYGIPKKHKQFYLPEEMEKLKKQKEDDEAAA